MKRAGAALAVVLAAGIAIPAASSGSTDRGKSKGKTYKVAVGDDFYAPSNVNVKVGDKIKWKWDSSNTDSHNVVLQSGPKKVKLGCKTKGKDAFSPLISKCNKSGTGAIGIKFKKEFDVKGTYKFVCTIHPTVMKLTVKATK
jgi:plastocyanin